MEGKWERLCKAINEGDEDAGLAEAVRMVENGEAPLTLFLEGIEPCLADIGDRFGRLEVFLPELMLAAKVVTAIQEELLPRLQADGSDALGKGRVVIGTIYGDIHDIGKSIVERIAARERFRGQGPRRRRPRQGSDSGSQRL